VDRYGRILRYVIGASHDRDVNRAQIRRGWTIVYVYNLNPFKRRRLPLAAERRRRPATEVSGAPADTRHRDHRLKTT